MAIATLVRAFLLSTVFLAGGANAAGSQVFALSGATFALGSPSATGTVTIDTTLGVFTDIDVTVSDASPDHGGFAAFTSVDGQQSFDDGTTYYMYSFSPSNDLMLIQVPVASLVGYTGGPLCFQGSTCGSVPYLQFNGKPLNYFTGGFLSPVPEPSTIAMLLPGLALFGLTVARRHRAGQPKKGGLTLR